MRGIELLDLTTKLHKIYGKEEKGEKKHSRKEVITVLGTYVGRKGERPQTEEQIQRSLEKAFGKAGITMRVVITFDRGNCPPTGEYCVATTRCGRVFLNWTGDGVVYIRRDQ